MNHKRTEFEKTAKILVVDDQPENLFAMEAMLKDVGAQVFKAASGKEALSMMLHHNFAMVFLDVNMPEMDGFELAKLIRGNDKTKNIPIIFLSAYSKEDQFIYKGYEAGAVDYILKPFNNDVVKQKAKVFLELYHQKALLEQTTLELSETNKKLQEAKDELELRIKERTQELTIANENLNQELEQRVVERTSQLEFANKELEAFSYSVSHDLRTPLRSIDGFSQVLLEEYYEKIDAQGQNYLQRIRTAAQHMAQLIDDILDLSRVSRGEMSTQQVNLSNLAEEIANDLHENQPERKVKFVIQEGLTVSGDDRLLRIVLENLIGNAWKFTSKHSTARIEFGMQLQKEIPVYFVHDDGAGFDMNYTQKLFSAFQRLHTNIEFPGTGIGLATVQRVILRHGGTVWAEGEVENLPAGKTGGATFYFTIPKKH